MTVVDQEQLAATEERRRLIESHNEASNSLDRALLSLAGGALGLSIAFVKDFTPDPTHIWALRASWILLGLSLVTVVLSFIASVEVHKRLIAGLDERRPYEQEPRWVRGGVTCANWIAAGLFLAGAGFLIVFTSVNL